MNRLIIRKILEILSKSSAKLFEKNLNTWQCDIMWQYFSTQCQHRLDWIVLNLSSSDWFTRHYIHNIWQDAALHTALITSFLTSIITRFTSQLWSNTCNGFITAGHYYFHPLPTAIFWDNKSKNLAILDKTMLNIIYQ